MEEIKLESSPAQLLAADGDDGDDGEPVSIHEPPGGDGGEGDDAEQAAQTPEQLTPEQKEIRRQLIRKISRYRSLFKAELADISTTA